jgi:hypothetical protein
MSLSRDIMRYGTRVRSSPDQVFDMAKEFFAEIGMKVTDEASLRLCLEKDDGFITMQFRGDGEDELDIITEGYDQRVKTFMKKLR